MQKNKVNKTKKTETNNNVLVLAIGGKQYVTRLGESFMVQKLTSTDKTIDVKDLLSGKKVTLTVGDEVKGIKISILKFKNKTRYMRRQGARQKYTNLTVESVA